MNFNLLGLILSIVWLCFVFFFVVLRNLLSIILFYQEMIFLIVENKEKIMIGIGLILTIVSIIIVIDFLLLAILKII